jgi:hypothetical protein
LWVLAAAIALVAATDSGGGQALPSAEQFSRRRIMSTVVIAPTVSPRAATIPADQIPDDPFHDSRLKFVGLALFLGTVATLLLLAAIYFGSLYGAPSWSAGSVPPPIVH